MSQLINIASDLKHQVNEVLGVAFLSSREFRRNLDVVLSGLTTAFALTVLLYFLLQSKTALLLVATGYVVAGSFNAGGSIAQRVFLTWRITKTLDVLMVSRLKPWNLVLGVALAACTYGFASDFIYISIISIITDKPEIILTALVIAPFMSLLGALIGLNLVLRIKSPLKAYSIYGISFFTLFYIPPVFYPVANMPDYLRPLVFLTPTGLAAELVRRIVGVGSEVYSIEVLAGAIMIWLVMLLVLTKKTVKWDLD